MIKGTLLTKISVVVKPPGFEITTSASASRNRKFYLWHFRRLLQIKVCRADSRKEGILFDTGEVVACQVVIRGLADPLQGLSVEGIPQAGGTQQLRKGQSAAQPGILQVGFKGSLAVLLHSLPEVQGHGLGQAVVDVIEGAGVDMALALPALALSVEGNFSGLDPGHVHAQQLQPDPVALLRGQLGLFVHDVLEVVHQGAVGDEGQGALQVVIAELPGILPEEAFRPGPGEELHGHGMDLTALHAGPDGGNGDAVTV